MKLSIIIPCHNEADRIGTTLHRVEEVMAECVTAYPEFSYEILAVENGSTDRTYEILKEFSQTIKGLKCVQSKKGKGNALKKGIEEANGEYVLLMDADNSTDIGFVRRMLDLIAKKDVDIINSSRRLSGSHISHRQSLFRRICGNMFHWAVKILFRLSVTDTQNGFKLLDRDAARYLFDHIQSQGWVTEVELFLIARDKGYTVVEIPVDWKDEGGSKLGLKDAPAIAFDMCKLLFTRTTKSSSSTRRF